FLDRDRRAREVSVAAEIRDPCGLPGLPDAAGQAYARVEAELPGGGQELGDAHLGVVPGFQAAKLGSRRVHDPQRADVPVEALADGLQDLRRRLLERGALG